MPMTPAEAAAFRLGLEAGAARLELTADCIRTSTTEAGTRSRDVEQLERALAEQAAFIRALPAPDGGEPTEAEVERVARAIIAEMSLHLAMVVELSLHLDEGDPPDWAELGEGDRRAVMQVARAALPAARGQS